MVQTVDRLIVVVALLAYVLVVALTPLNYFFIFFWVSVLAFLFGKVTTVYRLEGTMWLGEILFIYLVCLPSVGLFFYDLIFLDQKFGYLDLTAGAMGLLVGYSLSVFVIWREFRPLEVFGLTPSSRKSKFGVTAQAFDEDLIKKKVVAFHVEEHPDQLELVDVSDCRIDYIQGDKVIVSMKLKVDGKSEFKYFDYDITSKKIVAK